MRFQIMLFGILNLMLSVSAPAQQEEKPDRRLYNQSNGLNVTTAAEMVFRGSTINQGAAFYYFFQNGRQVEFQELIENESYCKILVDYSTPDFLSYINSKHYPDLTLSPQTFHLSGTSVMYSAPYGTPKLEIKIMGVEFMINHSDFMGRGGASLFYADGQPSESKLRAWSCSGPDLTFDSLGSAVGENTVKTVTAASNL